MRKNTSSSVSRIPVSIVVVVMVVFMVVVDTFDFDLGWVRDDDDAIPVAPFVVDLDGFV